ncbi:MAG: hypothetical protein C4525_15455 [Desulfarculus sp.]|jgi:hypothetical protein|nr:MAG: hypothetical protein C4525_15455 [Desulfarculus sp.]
MKASRGRIIWLLAAVALAALALGGCAEGEKSMAPAAKKMEGLPCAPAGKLVTQVAPEAKLLGLECKFAKYDRAPSLAVKVTLQNASSKDQRYRVHLWLDNDKAVGGLIPSSTKKGLVKPGAKVSFTYFFKGQDTAPGGMTVVVKPVSD